MSRVQVRLCVVAAVALTLVLAGVPSVGAGPLGKGSTPAVSAGHWFDAAVAWFGGLFDFSGGKKPTGKAPQGPRSVTAPALGTNAHTNNGSCIDPMGGPRCAV